MYGYVETTVEYLRNMMGKKGWDVEECMEILGIPSEKRNDYKKIILDEPILV